MAGMGRTSAAGVVALVAVALGVAGAEAASPSGLRGVVDRSPIAPVCTADDPCSAPAAHTQLAFLRNGARVVTRTDDFGHYRVILAPGWWSVRPTAPRIGAVLRPGKVRVLRNRIRVADFELDTGIR